MVKKVVVWFKGSIVRAILVALLLPAVTSIGLIAILFTQKSSDALTQQMERNLQQLVIAKAEETDLRLTFSDQAAQETLHQSVRDIAVLDGAGYGFLLDGKGNVVVHPAPEMQNVNLLLGASAEYQKRLRHMTDGNSGSGYYENSDGTSLLVYAPLTSTDWSLAITVPNEAVIAPAIQMRNQVLLFTGVMMLFVSGFSYLFAHLIHAPLAKLSQGVKQLSEEGRADPISVTSFDELRLLANAFNEMASKIWVRETRLKAKMAQLRIEIDAGKKEQRLEAIVETDFFKQLEIDADKLRAQMRS